MSLGSNMRKTILPAVVQSAVQPDAAAAAAAAADASPQENGKPNSSEFY